jgi:hypothetical protein
MTASDRGYAPEFLAAFLEEAGRRLPDIQWQKLSDYTLAYPESSPVLGTLTISFDWDEITVYFGRHHQHFTSRGNEVTNEAHQIAVRALTFIQELVNDRVVVRWGGYGSRTLRTAQTANLFRRMWRILTPWIREAVWSGRAFA